MSRVQRGFAILRFMDKFTGIRGARLRELRKGRALSQQDLERVSGVAQHTISELESGKRKARPSTVRKLANALGVEPVEIIDLSDVAKGNSS